jgi:hypothetical protein
VLVAPLLVVAPLLLVVSPLLLVVADSKEQHQLLLAAQLPGAPWMPHVMTHHL